MKSTFFERYKKAIGIAACILGFALITLVYFSPILEGKRIKQHDIEMYKGMSKEIVDYRASTGEQTLWTNSMFGGMPAWNISVTNNSNLMKPVHQLLSVGFPHPIGAVFISMLGFFILLLVLDCSVWISFIGGLAYGFTSYLFIIIGAGHNSKAMAMAYMAPVISGILLTYKGKYLWGSVLTAIALALEVRAGHLQITYYLLITVVCLLVGLFIKSLREKQFANFIKASLCLIIAAIMGILTNATTLYANYAYSKDTTRGKPVLTQDQNGQSNQTKGLDREYITQWSYGKGETWSLLIPNAKGGASAYIGKQNPALDKADPRYRDSIAQNSAYWGDQPGTSGPVYVGAIIIFLFVLGALTVKGELKWALLIATLLSILLSWGKNFMGFTDFFINHVPGYNKFRAVSMTLVIAEVTMPLLGLLGLAEIVKNPDSFKQNLKKFWIALGITAGCCLLFYVAPKLFFNFISQGEAQQFAQLTSGKDGAVYQAYLTQLEDVRVAIFRKDALRSLLFIILAAVPILLYGKGKLKAAPAFIIIAALVVIDLYPIDKRYLNNDNFISKKLFDKPFAASAADQYILNDKSLDFRVLNLTKDVFNDASTSYFHKSIGGYHGAKLRRYQDLITRYLSAEIRQFSAIFKNVDSDLTLRLAMEQQRALNMLNTKYIIYNPDAEPIENPCAFGNAWIVKNVQWVDTPNEEFDAIATTNLRSTAIVNKEFQQQVGNYEASNSLEGQVALTEYQPNKLTYSFKAGVDQLVVFSEIWSDTGWKLYVDGKEHPLLRANYLLRCALIPSGEHQIVMEYVPKAWKVGNTIQLASSLLLLLGLIGAVVFSFRKK
ncbi:MAG: YfhO family protein [Bacteroidales bacterium]|nr:YfhO family protein [Bacteroidales bacterium]